MKFPAEWKNRVHVPNHQPDLNVETLDPQEREVFDARIPPMAKSKNRAWKKIQKQFGESITLLLRGLVKKPMISIRRMFRSPTSDNVDRWKAEVEQKNREEKSRREKIREEKESEEKKMQVREKVGKSRNTVFFHWFVAPEDPNVGSLKRRVRSQLAKWEMKNCTPLGREAHFQVKMYKTSQLRTTFGSWDVEKVHAVVARSTFPSQNVQNISAPDHFWKLRCRKNAHRCGAKHICKHEKAKNTSNFDVEKIARCCGRKHISKSKCTKHLSSGPLLEVEMSKKCTPLWREAHFEVKMWKTPHARTTFGRSDAISRGRRKGLWTLSKSEQTLKVL